MKIIFSDSSSYELFENTSFTLFFQTAPQLENQIANVLRFLSQRGTSVLGDRGDWPQNLPLKRLSLTIILVFLSPRFSSRLSNSTSNRYFFIFLNYWNLHPRRKLPEKIFDISCIISPKTLKSNENLVLL